MLPLGGKCEALSLFSICTCKLVRGCKSQLAFFQFLDALWNTGLCSYSPSEGVKISFHELAELLPPQASFTNSGVCTTHAFFYCCSNIQLCGLMSSGHALNFIMLRHVCSHSFRHVSSMLTRYTCYEVFEIMNQFHYPSAYHVIGC